MGYLEVLAFLDLGELGHRLEEGGIAPRFARGPNSPVFLTATVGDRTIAIPGTLREQMLMEFMDASGLVAAIEHVASVRAQDLPPGEAVMLSFRDEGRDWEAKPVAQAPV